MKTTFDLPEPLLAEVRELARAHNTTSRSLVEQALRRLLDEHVAATKFTLTDASIQGPTLRLDVGGWDDIRDLAYGAAE